MNTKRSSMYGLIACMLTVWALFAACEQPAAAPTLTGITAVYSGSTVKVNADIDSLKQDLTVTAQYSNGSKNTLAASEYTLRGTLTVGTRTITVRYEDETTTFTVIVTDPNASLTLTGNISITPGTGATVNNELTATYTGLETVSYQWHKDEENVGTNSNKYTPDQAGSYTVTVSATGYNSKTSATVTVTAPPPGMPVSGSTLAAKLQWLNTNATSDTTYTITVSADEAIDPQELSYPNQSDITINLWGNGAEMVISLTKNGTLFTVGSDVTLVLDENITLKGRSSNTNSLLKVNSGGTLIMNTDSKITGNYTFKEGGGVYVSKDAIFTMNDGEISGNNGGSSGGGVYVYDGTFTMENGIISGNNGGGVYMVGFNATCTMNNGKITGNSGGGIQVGGDVYSNATFTMNDGEISGNSGGGVRLGYATWSSGDFTMNGGTISGNTAYSIGGGVYVYNGTFTMKSGTISGNTVAYPAVRGGGGGVYVYEYGIFRIVNGTVYGSNEGALSNTSENYTSALYIYSTTVNDIHYHGTAEYGTFSGTTWNSNGSITPGNYYNNTIRVVNGVLQ